MTIQAHDAQAPSRDTAADGRDRLPEETEPEPPRPGDRSEHTGVSRIAPVEARWWAWRSEALPQLDGAALLARTEQRLHAFSQGDRYGYDASVP